MEIIHARLSSQNNQTVFKEVRVVSSFEKAEFMLSKEPKLDQNDFEIQLSIEEWKKSPINIGDWLYIPETEWGGRVEKMEHIARSIKITGVNFRYFIGRNVIHPKYNNVTKKRDAYLEVLGEANGVLKTIQENTVLISFSEIVGVSKTDTGNQISGKFRYIDFLSGVVEMLDGYGMRLRVAHSYGPESIVIGAEVLSDYSEIFNQDFNIEIDSSVDETNEVNFMIGLGKGELSDRQIVYMLRKKDGTIEEVPNNLSQIKFDGVVKQFVLDEPNIETLAQLREKMYEKFDELKNKNTINLNFSSDEYELNLGDIVGGIDEMTGLSLKKEIIQKVLTIDSKSRKITYKVGD